MKKSLALATFFVVASGAAAAGAVTFATQPYVGSDTEFNITNFAILQSGLGDTGWTPQSATPDYTGGGSGGGEAAMVAGKQSTAPMSRMLKGGAGANACKAPTFTGAYTTLANASGIVIGIDAARIFASAAVINSNVNFNGGAVTPANACTPTTGGLAYNNANGNTMGFQNWRDVLALLYGGLDKDNGLCSDNGAACNPYSSTCNSGATCNPVTNCSSSRRQTLISNFGNLFQIPTANPNGTALTHAFRRDDNSGTSDVFSSLLGLQGASVDPSNNKIGGFSLSSSAINSFGTSPFCNALNWDEAEASAGSCKSNNTAANTNLHYEGPGGVEVPNANDANCGLTTVAGITSNHCHHVPPSGVYGATALGTQPWVFPTSFQDNDPLRVTCLGTGNQAAGTGENVCNANGTLGVVLPVPPLDFVPAQNPGVVSYTSGPTAAKTCANGSTAPAYAQAVTKCNAGSIFSDPPKLYTCAPLGKTGAGLCPNNDVPLGLGCLIPIGTLSGNPTSQCQAINSNTVSCFNGGCGTDARVYNLMVYDGTGTDAVHNAHFINFTVGGVALNHGGAFARIHQSTPSQAGLSVCHNGDATQQIGCLTNADPNAVGYGGNTGDVWETSDPLAQCGNSTTTSGAAGETVGLRLHPAALDTTNPGQGLGAGISCTPIAPPNSTGKGYPLWRKLYFNSIEGFHSVTATNELQLAEWESVDTNIDGVMLNADVGEFALPFGPNGNGPGGKPAPFCEDLNEFLIGCGASDVTPSQTANTNGCSTNAGLSGTGAFGTIPSDVSNVAASSTTSTVCGNGVIENYEDCDPSAALPTGCGSCSTTCRCSLF